MKSMYLLLDMYVVLTLHLNNIAHIIVFILLQFVQERGGEGGRGIGGNHVDAGISQQK